MGAGKLLVSDRHVVPEGNKKTHSGKECVNGNVAPAGFEPATF